MYVVRRRQRVVGADGEEHVTALQVCVIDQLQLDLAAVVRCEAVATELDLRVAVAAVRERWTECARSRAAPLLFGVELSLRRRRAQLEIIL